MIGRATVAVAACLALGHAGSATAQETEVNADVRAAARQVAGGEQDAGLERLETLAGAGDIDAHNMLGEMYAGFGGVERDRSKSCGHFRIAREARPSAAHNYGQCLWEGAFGERDFVEARVWYQRGADGGFLQAKCALGNMLIRGEGGPAAPEAGVALCREAAEAGEPNAQTDMGDHYLAGAGVAEDHAEARKWYALAAAQNQRNAAFTLGQMYWNGDTVEKDNDEAARLWRIAYEAGRTDAALPLARAAMVKAMADRTNPDAETLREAERWFGIAISEIPDPAEKAEAEQHLALVRRLLVLLAEREAAS